jgi:hypothetical protein
MADQPIEKKKKTNGKRNRTAGHDFERQIAELLRDAGFEHVITTRQGSRLRDAEGIDMMNSDELKHGRLPYNIQCKNTNTGVNYVKLLASLPKEPGIANVIFHKFTEKKAGGAFHPRGHYAILDMHDFVQLIARILQLQKAGHDSTH